MDLCDSCRQAHNGLPAVILQTECPLHPTALAEQCAHLHAGSSCSFIRSHAQTWYLERGGEKSGQNKINVGGVFTLCSLFIRCASLRCARLGVCDQGWCTSTHARTHTRARTHTHAAALT